MMPDFALAPLRSVAVQRLPSELLLLMAAFLFFGCAPTLAQTDAAEETISLTDLRSQYEIPASKYIDLDGVELHYADEGAGQPVILLHASFLNFRAWDGVAEDLVKNNYRVIRPDFPGLGLSGIDGKSFGPEKIELFERNAEIVAKLAEALKLGKVDVIATSSGAAAGFRFASYNPDQVNRLVLINSAGLPRTVTTDPNRFRPKEQQWAAMKIKPPAFWANMFERNFIAPNAAPDWLVKLAYDVNRRAENGDPKAYSFSTGDPKKILSAITAPTFIMWGKANSTVVHLNADVIEHWMTGAPTLIKKYEGLGHYPYIEKKNEVMPDILAFLSGQKDDDLRQTKRLKPSP